MSSGVIGSALFLIGLGSCFKDSFKLVREKIPGAVPAFAAFAAGLLNANTLSFFGEDWRGASFVFICLWAIIGCTVYQLKFAAPAENTR